jgi:hypothetical protein
MGIEAPFKTFSLPDLSKMHKAAKNKTNAALKKMENDLLIYIASKRIYKFARDTRFTIDEGALEKLKAPIANGDRIVCISTHHFHLDGVVDTRLSDRILEVAREIYPPDTKEKILSIKLVRKILDAPVTKQLFHQRFPFLYNPSHGHLRKFYYVISSTMENGKQGEDIQRYTQLIKPFMQAHDVEFVPVITENDVIKRNERGGSNEESNRKLAQGADKGYAIFIYPTGSTSEGQMREGATQVDDINGLGRKAVTNLNSFIRTLRILDIEDKRDINTWYVSCTKLTAGTIGFLIL